MHLPTRAENAWELLGMEWLFALVVIVVLLVMWSRAAARRTARLGLRRFEYWDELGDYGSDTYEADFVEMRFRSKRTVYDPGDGEAQTIRLYSLRRRDSGRWQVKLTEDSASAAIAELSKDLAQPSRGPLDDDLRTTWTARLTSLQGGAKWEPIAAEISAPLETQYQRFLLHYHTS